MKQRIKYDTSAGDMFGHVAREANALALSKDSLVEFDFNGINCVVDGNTDLKLLLRDYHNAHLMEWKEIGHECAAEYSPEIIAEIEARTKAQSEKRDKQNAEREATERDQRKAFEAKVAGIEVEFSNKAGWDESRKNNPIGYGRAALDFAEGWAKLMQIEIAKGRTVADCYNECESELYFMGISGFQYGCAASILAQTWKYGDQLAEVRRQRRS